MKKTKTMDTGPRASTIVFENGTVIGAVREYGRGTPTSASIANARPFVIPEIVISSSHSGNSLHQSRSDVGIATTNCGLSDSCIGNYNNNNNNHNNNRNQNNNSFNAANTDDTAAESSALLVSQNVLQCGMTDDFDVDADTYGNAHDDADADADADTDADADADADVDYNAIAANAIRIDVNAAEIDAAEADDDDDLHDPSSSHDAEFEQFVMNRTTSDSNILESSIYSELQFPPSIASASIISHIGIGVSASVSPVGGIGVGSVGGVGVGGGCNTSMLQIAGPQIAHGQNAANHGQPPPTTMLATTITPTPTTTTTATTIMTQSAITNTTTTVVDMLNTSACSRADSRQSKRSRRKTYKSKSKCSNGTTAAAQRNTPVVGVAGGNYPPQYTAIFLDASHHLQHHHGNAAASAIGQIANAAATSPFLNANATTTTLSPDTGYIQHHSHHLSQYQYFHHRPLMSAMGYHQHQHRNLLDAAAAPVASSGVDAAVGTDDAPMGTLNVGREAGVIINTALNSQWSLTFGKWLTRPSLPFVIGILALGGVACTLGGIVLGSTGLIEHSTQYLSAALLMIGIGVSLLVISGAIWRLSLPDDIDDCPCFRHLEACRSCNSPYCANRLMPGSYLYPEFQHRPPPPSYLTSLNECTAMGFFLHPSANAAPATVVNRPRVNTPPPNYRSTVSLNTYSGNPQTNTAIIMPSTSAFADQHRQLPDALPETNATKEINYLDLD